MSLFKERKVWLPFQIFVYKLVFLYFRLCMEEIAQKFRILNILGCFGSIKVGVLARFYPFSQRFEDHQIWGHDDKIYDL